MDSGRMPACDVISLGGVDIASGDENSCSGRDNTNYYQGMQPVITGNRCGHDKSNFKRPAIFADAKRRPHVLEEAKRRIYESIDDNFRYSEDFAGLFFHKAGSINKDGSERSEGRKRRTESIEGVFSIALPFLLHHLNLHRMACGIYDSGNNFHPQDFSYLQNKTDQSSIRVQREMAVLQSEGIIKVNPVKKPNNDGSYRTIRVEIEFTDKIFQMLDLMDEFLKDRETSSLKFHEKQIRLDRNRQKKELYRKPSFSLSSKNKKLNQSLQQQVQGIGKCTYKSPPKGRGQEIKELYSSLTAKGLTPQEAAEIIRHKYPPPH